jgi:predicted membrane protein
VFATLLLVLLIVIAIGFVLAAIATPIGNGETATLVASIVSGVITAPIFALAVSVLYFELGGGPAASRPAAPVEPPSGA